MSQQQQKQRKFQPCRNGCGQDIFWDAKLGRTETGGWIPMQFDSIGQVTKHVCPNRKQKTLIDTPSGTAQTGPTQPSSDLSKEIAAIKAQLLVLVSRLDRLEQELSK